MGKSRQPKGISGGEGDLRARAEKKLARPRGVTPEVKGETSEEVLHDLHVHQIELEMQNEELKGAHLALEESRDRYLDLYDFAPVGYFHLRAWAGSSR